jgi:hypothetical protein
LRLELILAGQLI